MSGIIDNFKNALHLWKDFDGRATRSEYWYFMLVLMICYFVFGLLEGVFEDSKGLIAVVSIVQIVFVFTTLIPCVSITTRRLHDVGKSGWWQLFNLLPLIGPLILLYFFCKDSVDDNQYGPNPKALNDIEPSPQQIRSSFSQDGF